MPTIEREDLAAKINILDEGRFSYNFDRRVYFNRATKKVFSIEFIQDHSASVLAECASEPNKDNNWQYYFNAPPSDSVRRQVEASLV